MLAVIAGSYYMIQTFIKDKKYGWLAALTVLVLVPLFFNFYSLFGEELSIIAGLLPLLVYLLFSLVLKFVVNNWIEETHFKAIRMKEKINIDNHAIKDAP
jgi:hypothetical protein